MRAAIRLLSLLLAAAPAGTAEAPGLLSALDKEIADLAARSLPGVVRVQVRRPLEAPPAPPVTLRGRVLTQAGYAVALCGFVWDRDGRIVTADVPDGTETLRVTLNDGREVEGKVLGNDPVTRLAVVQIAAEGLAPLPIGDSTALRPGSWALVLAGVSNSRPAPYQATVAALEDGIGGAGGPSLSLAAGTLPLASGAPVLNARGEVVGILLARTASPDRNGQGTAIPMHTARAIIEQLAAGRQVKRGFLGVMIGELTEELAKMVGLEKGAGVFVQDLPEGSPAAAAGVQAEDVILEVNGAPVRTTAQLVAAVQALVPGKETTLTLWRKGQKMDVKAIPGEMPAPRRTAQLQLPEALQIQPQIVPGPIGPRILTLPQRGGGAAGKVVSVDFQAAGLLEAVGRVLNGTAIGFLIDPAVLADEAILGKPFGMKATNAPLNQVLDQLCGHYGLAWDDRAGLITFRKK